VVRHIYMSLGFKRLMANLEKQCWYNKSAIVTNLYSTTNAQYLSPPTLLRDIMVTRCVVLAHGQSHVGKVFAERVYYHEYHDCYATVTQTQHFECTSVDS